MASTTRHFIAEPRTPTHTPTHPHKRTRASLYLEIRQRQIGRWAYDTHAKHNAEVFRVHLVGFGALADLLHQLHQHVQCDVIPQRQIGFRVKKKLVEKVVSKTHAINMYAGVIMRERVQ